MKYDFRKTPCIRIKLDNIQPGERHPCYFCGIPIDVSNIEDCPTCGIIPCPACGKCFCGISELEQETLVKIHEKYCCIYDNLLWFKEIEGITGDENIIKNSTAALRYCAEKFRQGNAYPFLENLSTGNIVNPYFGHDISEWMRYAVFGLRNIPEKAKRILDIGSGYLDGPKIYLENRPDIELYVVDPNVKPTSKIKIINDDMRNLRQHFEPESLDFVSCFETIEHVSKEDGINVINVIYDILRPDGVLVLSTPNKSGLHNHKPQGIHLYEWSYKEMFGQLGQKFRVTKVYGNRVDLSKVNNIDKILSGNEFQVYNRWKDILPAGILANIFSITHPSKSYISVFVCKK